MDRSRFSSCVDLDLNDLKTSKFSDILRSNLIFMTNGKCHLILYIKKMWSVFSILDYENKKLENEY